MPAQRWDLLLTHATLATLDGDAPFGLVGDGALAVADGRIAWVGPLHALPPGDALHAEDLQGRLLTPGLIDCHTHLVFAGHRAHEFDMRLNGASYAQIARAGGGILSTVRAVRAASEETLLEQSLPRARALLADGVTTLEIKSGYGLDFDNERARINSISAEHADLISSLVQELQTANADDDCLDELVLDGAGKLSSSLANESNEAVSQDEAISAGEEFGSELNNGGFAEQIAFIISGNGADEASNLVRRAAGLQPAMAL